MTTEQPRFFIRTMRVLLVVGMCCSVGLHWAALQTVAWTGMFIGFAQKAPLAEAVKKTFDGEHPCALCKLVAEGSQHERESDEQVPPSVAKKLDAILFATATLPKPPLLDLTFTPEILRADMRAEPPPVPPPRGCRAKG